MADDSNRMAAINEQFRTMMESSVTQAKKAYDQYVAGVERNLTSMEDANRIAWSGAREVNVRFMTFVDENARAGFGYAERLTKAKDATEMMSIQQDYFKRQSERLSEQMRELNEMSRNAARQAGEAAKPKS
jgi:phasin